MPSDYGDEAGEKLFDWMLRLGQDGGEAAIKASAERLKSAIKNIRGQIDDAPEMAAEEAREYARLNLSEFEELPDYRSLKEIIDEKLDADAIEHDFVEVDGHDHLIFRVEDAPEVDEMFQHLEEDVDKAAERAAEEQEKAKDKEIEKEVEQEQERDTKGYGKKEPNRDEEPLQDKAEAAREASKAYSAAKEAQHELERIEVKTR